MKSESADEIAIKSIQRPQKSPSESHLGESSRSRMITHENQKTQHDIDGRRVRSDIGSASRKRSSSDQSVSLSEAGESDGSNGSRQLSSPDVENSSIITASLKIPVPLSKHGHSSSTFALNLDDTDIPYIEDSNVDDESKARLKYRRQQMSHYIPDEHDSDPQPSTQPSVPKEARQRSGSNDSYLGQPITGSMTFQPIQKTAVHLKQSKDSALSTGSSMEIASSSSLRNTPSSDLLCVSGHSTPVSTPSPQPCRSDSSIPVQDPTKQKIQVHSMSLPEQTTVPDVPSPKPRSNLAKSKSQAKVSAPKFSTGDVKQPPVKAVRTRHSTKDSPKTDVLRTSTQTYSIGKVTTSSNIAKELKPQRPSSKPRTSVDIHKGIKLPPAEAEESKTRGATSQGSTELSKSKTTGNIPATRGRKYSRARHETAHLPDVGGQGPEGAQGSTATVWKRWEIIASDPNSPETFV